MITAFNGFMKLPVDNVYFKCLQKCALCCSNTNGFVFIRSSEAEEIAEYLGMDKEFFVNHFTRAIDDRRILVDGQDDDCLFLEDYGCSIYEVRPAQCRAYPFWPENLKSIERWEQTKTECPGIGRGQRYTSFEINEILKSQK
ncbi:MAG: YkgJ family cysteine cluster protein [Caldithrix sp.]|nr:YkgJ family cysteine cluster protein [Caldithrix sp.]